jgi:peptidoglycan/xylan/chitin deacetylase (PgdA/CDA1 family)
MMQSSTTVTWPLDRPIALSVSVMLEGWADGAAPGIGPMGNPLKAGVLDLQGRSWADYGPKVGAWRILDTLEAAQTKAVFYVSGILAERYPELLKAIVEAGHDVAAHGWTQDVIPAYQSPEEEARDLQRCVSVIEAATGRRPIGWLSPRCTPSTRTSALLAKKGFLWHGDIFDSDMPYWLDTDHGRILAMPFTMEVNDMPLYIRYGNEPEAFTRILDRLLTHWPQLKERPACLDLTVHAHVFGRPYGIIELANALGIARKHQAVARLTTHQELAHSIAKA